MPVTRGISSMSVVQVGTAVICLDDHGNVLLAKRLSSHQQGKFGCPGGKVEFGETLAGAAKRELEEETGIVASLVAIPLTANCYFENEQRHFVCHWFVCEVDGVKPKIDLIEKDVDGKPKTEGWGWYSSSEVENLPMMPSTYSAYVRAYGWDGAGSDYQILDFKITEKGVENAN